MAETLPGPPTFNPWYGGSQPVDLPMQWQGVALLTPFSDTQLLICEITYDWYIQSMRVTVYGLEDGYIDFFFTPSGAYLVESATPGGPPTAYYGPYDTDVNTPAPGFLAGKTLPALGTQQVLTQNCVWWIAQTIGTNGYQNPPPHHQIEVSNLFNYRVDNGLPWRMMFVNQTNDFRIPIIGTACLVHFPTFDAVTATDLGAYRESAEKEAKAGAHLKFETGPDLEHAMQVSKPDFSRDQLLARIQQLIPGIEPPPGSAPLPYWPERLYMTALTTLTDKPASYPTAVRYDWSIQRMLTEFSAGPDTLLDTYLTGDRTYLVEWNTATGTHKCLKQLPVGLLKPNWPTVDGGLVKGLINNNPDLSPGKTTQITVLPSQPPRYFWIWYTTQNEAVTFIEVPQLADVMLILTDYFDYNGNPPPFDPGVFKIPDDCQGAG